MAKKQQPKVKNFARFYTLLKRMPDADKEQLVSAYTNQRTSSLKEMNWKEYSEMCDRMEEEITGEAMLHKQRDQLKKARSAVLLRMTRMGIDTTDWHNVDQFCMNQRIIGKPFRYLSTSELNDLIPKLEAILKKDKDKESASEMPITSYLVKNLTNPGKA